MKNVEMVHALSFIGGFAGVTRLFISYSESKEKTCRAKRIDSDEDIMSKAHLLNSIDRLAEFDADLSHITQSWDDDVIYLEGFFGTTEWWSMLLGTRETFTVNSALEIKLMASFGSMFLTEMARAPEWDIKFPNVTQGWLIRDDFHDMAEEIRLFQRAKIYSLEDDSGTSIVDEEDYYKGLFGKPEFTSIELEESEVIKSDLMALFEDFHNNSLPVFKIITKVLTNRIGMSIHEIHRKNLDGIILN
ncbi:hypothetical protein ACJX0J_021295 [Zea mays]